MLQLYHGHGKGKTTAALGLAMRALGAGFKVRIIYFDKGGWFYHERNILDALKQAEWDLDYSVSGCQRFDPATETFRFGVTDEDKVEAQKGLSLAAEWMNTCDVLILDEINSTANLGMLTWDEVFKVIDQKPKDLELICTGRDPSPEMLTRADLITNVTPEKHYYQAGILARKGIEY